MKPLAYVVLALALLATLIFLFRGCDLYDKYSELKGQYDAYKQDVNEKEQKAKKTISEQETKIEKLQESTDKLIVELDTIEKKTVVKDSEIGSLEEELKGLKGKDEIIVNLKSQVVVWKEKFSLAQQTIERKDKIIFNLSEKYDAQLRITETWKGRFEAENRLRLLGEERIKMCDSKLRSSRFTSRIEKVIIVGLGGYIAYTLIKKEL